MCRRIRTLQVLVLFSMMMTSFLDAKASRNETLLNNKVHVLIGMVRTGSNASVREDAAYQLFGLLRVRKSARKVNEENIEAIVGLLSSSDDDLVRNWVASSIGRIGRRAKIAIPKLLELLSEVDCLPVSRSSAQSIRYALGSLGAPVPPECQ